MFMKSKMIAPNKWTILQLEICPGILVVLVTKSHPAILRPHGLSLLCPWDFSRKNMGVGWLSFFRESSQPWDQTCVSCNADRFFSTESPEKLLKNSHFFHIMALILSAKVSQVCHRLGHHSSYLKGGRISVDPLWWDFIDRTLTYIISPSIYL